MTSYLRTVHLRKEDVFGLTISKVLLQDQLASRFKAREEQTSEREGAAMVAASHLKKQGREEKPGTRNHTLRRHTPSDPTSSSLAHSVLNSSVYVSIGEAGALWGPTLGYGLASCVPVNMLCYL